MIVVLDMPCEMIGSGLESRPSVVSGTDHPGRLENAEERPSQLPKNSTSSIQLDNTPWPPAQPIPTRSTATSGTESHTSSTIWKVPNSVCSNITEHYLAAATTSVGGGNGRLDVLKSAGGSPS